MNSIDELIHNFNDDDDISELYFTALIVISQELEMSMDDAHHGVVDMFYEMQKFEIDKEHKTETKH